MKEYIEHVLKGEARFKKWTLIAQTFCLYSVAKWISSLPIERAGNSGTLPTDACYVLVLSCDVLTLAKASQE